MEIRQLRYFVAVAEEGGFGRAAERLSIVPSAVSQQIGRLERDLGVPLFRRTTRRVRLTGAGERLLPEARSVLAAADRTRRIAADIAAGDDGVLRLGAVHGPGDRTAAVLRELSVLAPRLRFRLRRLRLPERLAAVRDGELDAAFVRGLPAAPGLELLPVWEDPLYAALPADHPLAAQDVLRLAELGAIPLRLAPREDNPPFHDLVTGALRSAGVAARFGPPFTDLRETLAAIAAGPPSWTVFYEVTGLPSFPRVAVRPLAAPTVPTALAVPPGPPIPALRHLITALSRYDAAPPRPRQPPRASPPHR